MTHEQYLDEPVEVVDWALAFSRMEAKVANERIERARAEAARASRR